MVIKVYISGISGNKEVKKRQQRIMMILESKNIEYEAVDITEPGKESDKQFMQDNAKAKDSKHPLPPQIFNEEDYCGDYDGFDLANENDELEKFLKLSLVDVLNGKTEHSEKDSCKPPLPERNEEIIDTMVPNNVDVLENAEEGSLNNYQNTDENIQETDNTIKNEKPANNDENNGSNEADVHESGDEN